MSNVTPCAFLSIFLVRIPKKEICSIFGNRDDIGHKHKRGLWIINPSKLQQNQSRFQFITDSGKPKERWHCPFGKYIQLNQSDNDKREIMDWLAHQIFATKHKLVSTELSLTNE